MAAGETRGYATFEVTDAVAAQAVRHLVALVSAPSVSGAEAPATAAAEAICAELGLPTRRMPVAAGRDNLVVGPTDAKIVLCTHLDVVPPHIPARLEGEWIAGRGACDAKGVAIAMLHGLAAVRAEMGAGASAGCLLVVGEETDHVGAKVAVERGLAPRHIILGEPCGLAPAAAQKGLLKVQLDASGRSGHSAYPELGRSAVHALIDALHRLLRAQLPRDALLGETTVNVGLIEGGVAANVIAPGASATVLVRCAAPVDAVLAAVEALVPPELTVTELSRAEPRELDTVGQAAGPTVPFNTDANVLAATGARLTLMGPGDMRCAHGPEERLAVADLRRGIEAYARAVARLL